MKPFHLLTAPLFAVCALLLAAGCGPPTRYIFSSSAELVGTPAGLGLAYEEVWFPAADGVLLHGWLVPGSPELPLVLFFHGNAANISHRVDNLRHLHEMGFSVFIFDYRGFGQSRGEPLDEADLQQDARGALAWLAALGLTPERMIYFGRSMGAAVALALALEAPPAGIVLEAPFTSLGRIARHLNPISWSLVGWWTIGDRFDNLEHVRQVTSPLLIFHGDRDPVVPLEMSRRLFARARTPKTLYVVEGAGHSDSFLVGGEGYRRAWLDFAASLPLPSPAAASRSE